jgi:hypothetical protein
MTAFKDVCLFSLQTMDKPAISASSFILKKR